VLGEFEDLRLSVGIPSEARDLSVQKLEASTDPRLER